MQINEDNKSTACLIVSYFQISSLICNELASSLGIEGVKVSLQLYEQV